MDFILFVLGFIYGFGAVALTLHGTDKLPWPRRLAVGLLWPVWVLAAVLFWRRG